MSRARYEDLVAMGAPRLPDNLRYFISSNDKFQSIYVEVQERSFERKLLGGQREVWTRVGRGNLLNPVVDGHVTGSAEWERRLVQGASWALASASEELLYRVTRDAWSGGHP